MILAESLLIDTNILLRTLQVYHPQNEVAARAVELLPQQGKVIHVVPQNLVELWIVATRPDKFSRFPGIQVVHPYEVLTE